MTRHAQDQASSQPSPSERIRDLPTPSVYNLGEAAGNLYEAGFQAGLVAAAQRVDEEVAVLEEAGRSRADEQADRAFGEGSEDQQKRIHRILAGEPQADNLRAYGSPWAEAESVTKILDKVLRDLPKSASRRLVDRLDEARASARKAETGIRKAASESTSGRVTSRRRGR